MNKNYVMREAKKLHKQLVGRTNELMNGLLNYPVGTPGYSKEFKVFIECQEMSMRLSQAIYNKEYKKLVTMLVKHGYEIEGV